MNLDFENARAISLLNAVLEATADGILVISTDNKVVKANKKFQELWKIPDAVLETKDDNKLLGFILEQLVEPEIFLKGVQELYNKPEQESFDILYFKDGRIYERYSAPYKVENSILGRVWSFSDITKQKIAEESLKEERILFKTIMNNLPDSIYAKDMELRKILTNPKDLYFSGCSAESEVLGKTDFELYPKESAMAFYNDDKKVIETGQSVENREESFVDKEGNRLWLLTSKIPLKDAFGKITGLIGVGRDITKRKKNELIREALYDISEAVLITNDMSALYKRIHQVVSNLMPANNFFIALYDDKKNEMSFPYFVDESDPPPIPRPLSKGLTEYILRMGESALIDAEKDLELRRTGEAELIGTPAAIWLGVPLKNDGKSFGVIVLQDYENPNAYGRDELQLLEFISEQIAHAIARKQNAEAIKEYNNELRELNQTKDKFFSIIAHDLKNPFVTLLGFSEILLSDFKDLQSEEILYYINEMKQSADLSFNLLQNLLQWSRSQMLEINRIVQQNIQLVRKTADRKEIQLKNNAKPDLIAFADEDMVNTIIRNLLTNAIKFTNKNGIVFIDAYEDNGFVKLLIKDSGVGMDHETVNKLFRLDTTQTSLGTENESGTGLGLLLCSEFVEKHGGKIWVESEKGKGSSFFILLPINKK